MLSSFWLLWNKPLRSHESRPHGKRQRQPKRLGLEGLEERRLLAATLVKDIYLDIPDSNPAYIAPFNGEAIFAADDGIHGVELWKSDGSTGGTLLLKDINPNSTIVVVFPIPDGSNPAHLTAVDGNVFFAADDGTNGVELWKTDGTTSGTVLLKNISPSGSSSPANLTASGGLLYFTADDGVNGVELWKSDGTNAGTALVKNINSGGSSSPSNLTDVNGTLYFTADDGVNGVELWKSDGTPSGTTIVTNIFLGAGGSNPSNLTNINGTLYFAANDGVNGAELWKSDGTPEGTVLVADINPGFNSSNPASLVDVDGVLYFAANDGSHGIELWKSNGTAAGTGLVEDINATAGSNPGELIYVNGTLFFRANNGINGTELWQSDGTAAGTTMLVDIKPGAQGSTPANLSNANGTLMFNADNGVVGAELWQSDGTAAGTVLVTDIQAGANGSNPNGLRLVGQNVFFQADDGVDGIELWKATVPNARPLAAGDNYTFGLNSVLIVPAPGVLANDTDVEGDALTAELAQSPTHGVLALNADGSFTYTPVTDFNGRDSFKYRAHDGAAASVNAATVQIVSREYRWVESLYVSILGRDAGSVTEPEVLFWTGALRTGSSRTQVVTALEDSDEGQARLINSYYRQYLGRDADAGALVVLMEQMDNGLSHAGVVQIIVGSSEYYLRAGTDAIFVEALYRDLLGRAGSTLDTGFWRSQLASGLRRDILVGAFLSSTEYRAAVIGGAYQRLLGRSVDAAGMAFWLGQAQSGRSLDDVETTLLASDEYFARQ